MLKKREGGREGGRVSYRTDTWLVVWKDEQMNGYIDGQTDIEEWMDRWREIGQINDGWMDEWVDWNEWIERSKTQTLQFNSVLTLTRWWRRRRRQFSVSLSRLILSHYLFNIAKCSFWLMLAVHWATTSLRKAHQGLLGCDCLWSAPQWRKREWVWVTRVVLKASIDPSFSILIISSVQSVDSSLHHRQEFNTVLIITTELMGRWMGGSGRNVLKENSFRKLHLPEGDHLWHREVLDEVFKDFWRRIFFSGSGILQLGRTL